MDSIIKTFHIDWHILIAQVVNFAVVVGVLWWLAIKPLMAVMTERTKTIEQSLRDAQAAAQRLQEADAEKRELIKSARIEAQSLIAQGQTQAAESQRQMVEQAQQQVKKIVADTKQQLAREQQHIVAQAKAEVAQVVIAAAQAVLGKTVDTKIDARLVDQTLKSLDRLDT